MSSIIQVPVTIIRQQVTVPVGGALAGTGFLSQLVDGVQGGIWLPRGQQLVVVPDESSASAVITDTTTGVIQQLGPWATSGGAPISVGPFRRNAVLSVGAVGSVRIGLTPDYLSKTIQFQTDKADATDDLLYLLEGLTTRMDGEDENEMPALRVDFLGRYYELSQPLTLQRPLARVEFANGALIKSTSTNWTPGVGEVAKVMITVGNGGGGGVMTLGIGFDRFALHCRRGASGISFDNHNECYYNGLRVEEPVEFGIGLFTRGRAFEGIGGRVQEYGFNDEAGWVYDDRTASGIYVSQADGYVSGLVAAVCKVGIKVDNIRNFLFSLCHPWMGQMNENDRFRAPTIQVGNQNPAEPGASGLRFSTMYIDHGVVHHMGSFSASYDNCLWTGGEQGIPPFVLEAIDPESTALGLSVTDMSSSDEHDPDIFTFTTSGVGTWASRKLYTFSSAKQHGQRLLPSKSGGTLWSLEVDENGAATGPFTALTQVQNAEAPVDLRLGSVVPSEITHDVYATPRKLVISWGPTGIGPGLSGARSLSAIPGIFAGGLLNNTNLQSLIGHGDNGTGLGGPEGAVSLDLRTAAAWGPGSQPTKAVFKTTPAGQVQSIDQVEIGQDGSITPINAGSSLGSTLRPWELLAVKRINLPSATWVPVVTAQVPGNLSVVYTLQTARYFWNADGTLGLEVEVEFTPTYTTASGEFRISGFPAGVLLGSTANQDMSLLIGEDWEALAGLVKGRYIAGSRLLVGKFQDGGAWGISELPSGVATRIQFFGSITPGA